MKDRRELINDGLAAAAALLSGTGIGYMAGNTEENECVYNDKPTYSVSVNTNDHYLGSFQENYDLKLEENEQRPAGMPEELYDNSSKGSNSR